MPLHNVGPAEHYVNGLCIGASPEEKKNPPHDPQVLPHYKPLLMQVAHLFASPRIGFALSWKNLLLPIESFLGKSRANHKKIKAEKLKNITQ